MGRKVIIVESPNKAKTIRSLIGSEYEVMATVGHFCDLPLKEMGVDIPNGFKPTYVYDPDKKDVVKKLRELKTRHAPDDIIVASDADREGEAIAWHIARTIGLKPNQVRRAEFHEITEPGLRRALRDIRSLDLGLVAAQEARRILDRLVGYTVSPVVRDRLPEEANLSAGRVQSVALRVVVDRELAIRAFQPREYWSVHAHYAWPGDPARRWTAEAIETVTSMASTQIQKPSQTGASKLNLPDREAAQALQQRLKGPHRIIKITRRESQTKPPAPFITSTLLQKASTLLKMTTDETTRHAKTLFERGVITYIRTDSPVVSPEFQQETREYLLKILGAAVLPKRAPTHKPKAAANAQGAHECIRPTRLDCEKPEGIDARAQALYGLIRATYLASQCKPATYDVTEVWLRCDEILLKAQGRVLKDPGFLSVFGHVADPDETEQTPPLPVLEEGQLHVPVDLETKQHWTKPPERFTEASLIKYLEEKGIGRPSTFNTMVAKIRDRQFVGFVNKRYLQPTNKGERLDGELRQCFEPVLREGFTAELERHLDAIAMRNEEWRQFLGDFWETFTPLLDAARTQSPARRRNAPTGPVGGEIIDPKAPPCPKCQKGFTRRIRSTKSGKDYYVCGRDSQQNKVCGYIAPVEMDESAPEAPACYRCAQPMKWIASRKAFRCCSDPCNTWLDEKILTMARKGLSPPCPLCQSPTRPIEGKGYGCIKWRKEGGDDTCQGWVRWQTDSGSKRPKKTPRRKKPQ